MKFCNSAPQIVLIHPCLLWVSCTTFVQKPSRCSWDILLFNKEVQIHIHVYGTCIDTQPKMQSLSELKHENIWRVFYQSLWYCVIVPGHLQTVKFEAEFMVSLNTYSFVVFLSSIHWTIFYIQMTLHLYLTMLIISEVDKRSEKVCHQSKPTFRSLCISPQSCT